MPPASTTCQSRAVVRRIQKFLTALSEASYLLPLHTENKIGVGQRKVAIQRRFRMHLYARSIAELRSSLREMLTHDISNPDEDPHLSGVMFFCATDEHSRQLIERIELLASEVFFDPNGRAITEHLKAAAVDGVRIKRNRQAPADETVIRIAVADKGYITVSTARF